MAKVNHKIFSEIAASFADPKRVYVTEDKIGYLAGAEVDLLNKQCRQEQYLQA